MFLCAMVNLETFHFILLFFLFPGTLSAEVILMDLTYSDIYALFQHDHKAQAYFNELPGYIQDQIKARKHAAGSYDALVQMAEDAQKVF